MSKAVLISLRQEWCEKIINGRKTIEVRKTRPKMDTPFKCYIYKCGNGKVVGEFLCDQIININGAGRIPSDAARISQARISRNGMMRTIRYSGL